MSKFVVGRVDGSAFLSISTIKPITVISRVPPVKLMYLHVLIHNKAGFNKRVVQVH